MNPTALIVAVTFAFGTTILAQTATPEAPRAGDATVSPAEAVRKLSKRERNRKIAALEVRHQDFVADVEPIIAPPELDAFLMMETDAQRDSFIDDFWRRRDALQGTSNRAFRDIYTARLEIAKEQFRSLSTDRAKMFLLHGPPAQVLRPQCQRLLQPIEIWKYPAIRGVGRNVDVVFYKPRHHNEYRLWNPLGGSMALADLVAGDSPVTAESASRRQAAQSDSPYAWVNRIQLECADGHEIMAAIGQMVQNRVSLVRLFEPPAIDDEQVQKMLRSVVIANPEAEKLTADFSVAYPAKDGMRTDVQMTLLVPREEVTPSRVGAAEVYTLDVTGEVLRNGKLWEKYRYRFNYPGDFDGKHLPIVIDRFLRPAEYVSRIKVIDAASGAEAIVESALDVPEIFIQEPLEEIAPAVAEASPAPADDSADIAAVEARKPRLRIIPPPEEIIRGIQTVETLISGDGIKAVEFWLDSRKLAVRRAPPFALHMDFGAIPRPRRVRAVGLDAKGEPITGDDVIVNAGTDPFSVRIVSPRVAPRLVGMSRIEMDVAVPEGEELGALELYWNENRVATLYDPPFVQSIDIPATEGVGYIRAVATLKDESVPPVEDVVMINTPAYMQELNVHLVELPTTVLVNGKPASHLTEQSFRVLDEGKPVTISRFDYVKDLPLSIGMAVDSSGSMQHRMDEARKAGAQFFESVMKKGDKAFLVAFDKEPRVVQKWSTRVADVHAGLATLRAEDLTSLYDAIVYSLYNFQGIRGQKALVVVTDGRDTASTFTFDQALEYARRAAVPIYGIGLGIRGTDLDVRHKLDRLCTETGGSTYYIEQARDLQRVYDDIQTELRSQYILGFYPSPDLEPGKWREVTVQVTEGKAKTVRGYFP